MAAAPNPADLSTDPDANTTIGGVNVAEGCSPAGLNNVERYLGAAIRVVFNQVRGLSGGMPVSGGAFTGDITRQGRGAYLHHAGSAQTSGKVTFLPEGSATPTLAEGDVVFFYS